MRNSILRAPVILQRRLFDLNHEADEADVDAKDLSFAVVITLILLLDYVLIINEVERYFLKTLSYIKDAFLIQSQPKV